MTTHGPFHSLTNADRHVLTGRLRSDMAESEKPGNESSDGIELLLEANFVEGVARMMCKGREWAARPREVLYIVRCDG